MVSRRKSVLLGAAGVVVGAAILIVWTRKAEPTHQSKTVDRWFQEFRRARIVHRVKYYPTSGALGFSLPNFWREDWDGVLRDPATVGLQAMGTNAANWLQRELSRGDSPFELKYRNAVAKLPRWMAKIAPTPSEPRDAVRADVVVALRVLGMNATSAVPALTLALTNPVLHLACLETLCALPYEPDALDPTLQVLLDRRYVPWASDIVCRLHLRTVAAAKVLTNAINFQAGVPPPIAFAELGHFREYAAIVVPALASQLIQGNATTRQVAARALRELGPLALPALPDILQALEVGDDELRYEAVGILERMGPNAVAAIPQLIQATSDTNPMVQRAAARALENISRPEPR